MAKRAKKPPKKREQPWMAAAREKLHAKSPRREDLAIQEAFAEIANHAADDDPGAAPAVHTERARMAWNLPLVHELSTEPGSEGAAVRAEVAAWLARPAEEIAVIAGLAEERATRFAHLGRPVLDAYTAAGALALVLGRQGILGAPIPLDDTGWPDAGRCLIELAEPARVLFSDEESQKDAETAVRLAELAWNLHTLDLAGAALPESLREEVSRKAATLREISPGMDETLDEMAALRRTRFGHDRRLLKVQSVRLVDDDIHLEVASVDPRDLR